MKLLKYALSALGVLVLAGAGVVAVLISMTDDCPAVAPESGEQSSMQAVRQLCYGPPESLFITSTAVPEPGPGELRIRVHSAGVNPLDWHTMRGSPYVMRLGTGLGHPKEPRFGVDFAGTVDAVGSDVSRFEVGQRVFGGYTGAFAEYLVMPEDRAVARLPDGSSFAEGAAVAVAGLTALQALRDLGQLQAGQSVLINGASGGVGTFAVQIAATEGARVFGVSSTRNVQRVLDLGAEYVFDYTREDYTQGTQRFDLIIDIVGNHSPMANAAVLEPDGRLVLVGGPGGDWIGPLIPPLLSFISGPFIDQETRVLLARLRGEDLEVLADHMATGAVTPVIDRHFPLSEVAAAVAYSETGRARGKIILDVAAQ